MIHQIGRLITVIALCAFGITAQAQLSVNVDRQQISDADLVKLSIRVDGTTTSANPDFSAVERDFEIVSRAGPNTSSRISIINGRQTSEAFVSWELMLRPKRLGDLSIPAFRIGSDTSAPISINVTPQTAAMKRKMSQLVFFDTSVDTNETYVQGQIIYTIKLYYVENISGDFPAPPEIPDAVIETIESERRYDSVTNGRRYYVLEKRYGIYPQSSGELVIPAQTFSGYRVGPGFFSTREPVMTRSESHRIEVKPKPASFDGDNWLPAKAVTIEEQWAENPPEFQVGEPINRTITLSATGVAKSLLPRLDNLEIEGAKTYQDPPVEDQETTEAGLKSTITTVVGIVPTKPGKLVLPEIRIPWWNTQTNTLQVALIKGQTYDVSPAVKSQVKAPSPDLPVASDDKPQQTISVPLDNTQLIYWQYATLACFALWLVTLALWFILSRFRRREGNQSPKLEKKQKKQDAANDAFQQFASACNRNDGIEAQQYLTHWARQCYPNLTSLHQLPKITHSEDLAVAINELEKANYSVGGSTGWQGESLLTAVKALDKPGKLEKRQASSLQASINPA